MHDAAQGQYGKSGIGIGKTEAAGERVGAFDVFDHVAKGDAQMYHGAEYYFTGKEKSFGYFTAVPFGLTYTEFNAWMRLAGGSYVFLFLTS